MVTKRSETLDRWIVYGNCLVGYIYDSKNYSPGTRVITDVIRYVDPVNLYAEDLDTRYKLKTPGTKEEHNSLIVPKKDLEAGPCLIDNSGFINPRG